MNASSSTQPVLDLLLALKNDDYEAAEKVVQASVSAEPHLFAAVLRSAIFDGGGGAKYYRKIRNVWSRAGRPPLKRLKTQTVVEVLSDGTVDGLVPHLELFLAAYGISATINVGTYDSVEHEAFAGEKKDPHFTIVILSEQWVRRHIPVAPTDRNVLERAQSTLTQIVEGLKSKRTGAIVIGSFYQGAWPPVGGTASAAGKVSWLKAIQELNNTLLEASDERIVVADIQTALHSVGGATAGGKLATIRMHAPFEEIGFVAVGREFASVLANLLGRSHRALLTDWDNTLWGGEVGELGFAGIQCGLETPDGYGYFLLQSYIRDLSALGVLLAAVSRNDPSMANVLDDNPHLALGREHFASLALSWGDKSQSVARVSQELSFGTDLMVYIDDNHVDLAEVLAIHPEIDVVLAGPEPDQSLRRMSQARFFNTARLTEGDLHRSSRAATLREQRAEIGAAPSKEAFLASLDIKIEISDVNAANRDRVLQLLQKTNQFNLTTRRHASEDLDRMVENGAEIGVFGYTDRFGPQGIIGLMIACPDRTTERFEIDTWLMSCRVLNRGVEESMLSWAETVAGDRDLSGTYIPTPKNTLVRDLYPRLGFREIEPGSGRYMKSRN